MIVLNGREIYSSISAGKISAAYIGKEVINLGQGATFPGSTGSWCGSMKQARIYTKALTAQEIASIAGIEASSPLSVPLLLESHPTFLRFLLRVYYGHLLIFWQEWLAERESKFLIQFLLEVT